MKIENLQKAGELKKELDYASALNKFFEVATMGNTVIELRLQNYNHSFLKSVNSKQLETASTEILKVCMATIKQDCMKRIQDIQKQIEEL